MKKITQNEIILGIQWEMNSSASLMINGEIISAVSEERFSNIKNDERYPKKSIDYILKSNKIKPSQISSVVFATKDWSPSNIIIRKYSNFTVNDFIYEQEKYWFPTIFKKKKIKKIDIFKKFVDLNQFPGKQFWKKYYTTLNKLDEDNFKNNEKVKILGNELRKEIIKIHLNIDESKISFTDHSLTHASYAYYSGNLNSKKSLVLTLDAYGDKANNTIRVFLPSNKKIYVNI